MESGARFQNSPKFGRSWHTRACVSRFFHEGVSRFCHEVSHKMPNMQSAQQRPKLTADSTATKTPLMRQYCSAATQDARIHAALKLACFPLTFYSSICVALSLLVCSLPLKTSQDKKKYGSSEGMERHFLPLKTLVRSEMRPGLLVSGRHSLPLVSVQIYRPWRSYRYRPVVARSFR